MKFITKHHPMLLLVVFTILGGFLRFWGLDSYPASLNWDEVSHGVNANSILITGKDEWGNSFPFIFQAFGDFKLPLYIYLSAIPVWLFGLGAFSVRFISALAGTLAILGIFLLVRELFPNRKLTLGSRIISFEILSAFILALLPWHFFISRPALEANLSLTLIIFGFYFLVRFFNKTSSLLPSVILLGLSLHTYNTARVFVPLLVLASFLIYKPKVYPNFKNSCAVFIAIILSGLVIYQVFAGEGTARYEKLKILSPSVVFQIGEDRSKSNLPPVFSKLVHNRPVYFVTNVTKNYLNYFSPSFFSQSWGAQYQFAIPQRHLLTWPVFILALVGIFSYFSVMRTEASFRLIYAWLFLSPLAAALTADPPQALRPNPMIPAIVIFTCFGISRLFTLVSSRFKGLLSMFLVFWFVLSFGLYLKNYFLDYTRKYSSSWQYGYAQVVEYIKAHESEYNNIFVTKRYGEPHIFYAFYSTLSPEKLHPGPDNIRFTKSDWFWTDKLGKVYFVNDWQIPTISIDRLPLESGGYVSTKRSLLITSPDHIPVNAHIIDIVKFLDGSPAFIITSVP